MATGQPRILTWRSADRALRLYEYTPTSGFVQIATGNSAVGAGGTEVTSVPPFFAFVDDSKSIFINTNIDRGEVQGSDRYKARRRLIAHDLITVLSALPIVNNGQSSFVYRENVAVSKFSPMILTPDLDQAGDSLEGAVYYGDDLLAAAGGLPQVFSAAPNATCLSMHPYDEFVYLCKNSKSYIVPRTGYTWVNGVKTPTFTPDPANDDNDRIPIILPEVIGIVKAASWSPDGKYLFVGTTTGVLYAYEVVALAAAPFTYSFKLLYREEYPNQIANIKVSLNGRFIAASNYNPTTGAYTTVIYRLSGPIMVPHTTVNAFGKLMNWSRDSKMLIDCGQKKMFVFNEDTDVFDDRSSLMTNIVAGAEFQAVSTHSTSTVYIAHVFSKAARLIAANAGGIDLTNLKIRLYDKEAKFISNLENINNMPPYGGSEVYGEGGWPQGGVKLENVAYGENNAGEFTLEAENLERILLTGLTFRTAMIYDATNATPLVWYDFLTDISVQMFKMLRFDLSEFGIVSFK